MNQRSSELQSRDAKNANPRRKRDIGQPKLLSADQLRNSDPDFVYQLYERSSMNEVIEIYEAVKYKGFNRDLTLRQMSIIFKENPKDLIHLLIAIAIRGPVIAHTVKLPSGKTARDYEIPISLPRTDSFSLNKMLAATPDLIAKALATINPPSRFQTDLPIYFQFPSAAALHLNTFKLEHRRWSIKFSELIGGQFREELYEQIAANKIGSIDIENECKLINDNVRSQNQILIMPVETKVDLDMKIQKDQTDLLAILCNGVDTLDDTKARHQLRERYLEHVKKYGLLTDYVAALNNCSRKDKAQKYVNEIADSLLKK